MKTLKALLEIMVDEPKTGGIPMLDKVEGEVTEESEVVEEQYDDDDDMDLNSVVFKFDDDEDDETEEDEPAETEPAEPEEEYHPEEPEKTFTQDEVNRIVGSARIKGRELEEQVALLEQQTGMRLPEVNDFVRQKAAQNMVDEYGIPEEQARQIVDNDHKVKYLEEHLNRLQQQQAVNQQMFTYNQDKQKHLSNPLVKRYEAEIDAVVQNGWTHGQQIGFEAAMRYVLGGKVITGDVSDNIRSSVQQQQARTNRRPMMAPEGVAGGAAVAQTAPRELQALARAFGADPKNVAREYFKEQKRRPF